MTTPPTATLLEQVEPDLQARGVVAGYGRVKVLTGVSLEVRPSSVTAVLGRNGVGKTTFLRCVSGMVKLSEGQLTLRGENIAGWDTSSRVRAGLAHVPEGRRMVPGFTVAQLLRMGGYTLSRRVVSQTFDEVLTTFPVVTKWLPRDSTSLSGGQQQLVAIARALMARPKVLMLDEPLTGLAPSVANEVLSSISELARNGLTVLLVEQNVRMALDVAESVCVLEDGEIRLQEQSGAEGLFEEMERILLRGEEGRD